MPVDHSKNIVELENVSFAYGQTKVLEEITLDIHQGDYVGVVGPNGAGKTTLLKIMAGLLTAKSGRVSLFGQNIKRFKDWQKISYVPQKATNFDNNFPATVREVVAMARQAQRSIFRPMKDADEQAVEAALKQVSMWEHRERLIGDLSGGQQQRVFIARALVNQPSIIFLDEPTTGVDKQTQDGFYALLRGLNQNLGITLVLVSHDISRLTQEVMHIACVDRSLTCHMTPEDYLKEGRTYHHHH